jgi:hypothetical protein
MGRSSGADKAKGRKALRKAGTGERAYSYSTTGKQGEASMWAAAMISGSGRARLLEWGWGWHGGPGAERAAKPIGRVEGHWQPPGPSALSRRNVLLL